MTVDVTRTISEFTGTDPETVVVAAEGPVVVKVGDSTGSSGLV
jgi:hypothetical protein